jgi:hypothetical protein
MKIELIMFILFIIHFELWSQNDTICPFKDIKKVAVKIDLIGSIYGIGFENGENPGIPNIDSNIISNIYEIAALDKDSVFWTNLLCNGKVIYHKRAGLSIQYWDNPVKLNFIKANGDTMKGCIWAFDQNQFAVRYNLEGWDIILDKENSIKFKNRLEKVFEIAFEITMSNFRSLKRSKINKSVRQ